MLLMTPSAEMIPEFHYLITEGALLLTACILSLATTGAPRKRVRSKETKSLGTISSMINRSLDTHTILETGLEELLVSLVMDAGILRLRAANVSTARVVSKGFSKEASAALEGIADEDFVRHSQPHIFSEVSRRDDSLLTETLRNAGMHFFAVYPVLSGNQAFGSLLLASRNAHHLSGADEEYLRTFCDILGIALAHTQLREQSNKLSEDLVALQEVNKIISQSFDLEDIIRRIVIEGKRLAKTSQCHLFLLDSAENKLIGSASTQTDTLDIRKVQIEFSEASTPVKALRLKHAIALGNIAREERVNDRLMESLGWHAAIFAPLLTKQQALGILVCSDESADRKFTQEEILRAEALAHQAAIALESARLFQVVSRSQKEWETTFDAMQDCVSVHDTTGKVIRANVALARRFSTIPQKIIGRYCSQLYGEDGPESTRCRHSLPLGSDALIVEEVNLPQMGGVFQLSVSPWYDKNNRLAGSIHVAKDINNEKMLQQQLIQSEKLSAIGELISGIAHELNNPLTGVMGYSQLLQLRKDLDDPVKESLQKINNLALRCQKIVQNLLSFARKQKPERTLTDINEIIGKTVELRSYELQVNNIEIRLDLDRDLPKTIADAHQLQQVFLNIVTNAEHAMLESNSRGILHIRTKTDPQMSHIVVEIKDDGPGIPENHLNKIFDPFFTTKEVGKGTGLGLSLSYGMIKEHGGNIYVHSRLNEGATFFVELPVIDTLLDDTGKKEAAYIQDPKFDELLRQKRILVVDDETYILDFFVDVFQSFSISIDTAGNGLAALERMENVEYDLIISDFRMPLMSGKELFNWIVENRPRLANRIIFVTGDTVSNETSSFFDAHQCRFLAKPFKLEEVKEVIQTVIEENT